MRVKAGLTESFQTSQAADGHDVVYVNNANERWYAPASYIGVHQLSGPWDGKIVDVYLVAGVAQEPLYQTVHFRSADEAKGQLTGADIDQNVRNETFPTDSFIKNYDSTKYYLYGWTVGSANDYTRVLQPDEPFRTYVYNERTYYAQWRELATVKYVHGLYGTWDESQSTFKVKQQDKTWDNVPAFPTACTETTLVYNLNNPTGQPGYRFTGWYRNSDTSRLWQSDEIAANEAVPENGVLTYEAQWEPVTVKVEFEPTGAALAIDGNPVPGTETTGATGIFGTTAQTVWTPLLNSGTVTMLQTGGDFAAPANYELVGWTTKQLSQNSEYAPNVTVLASELITQAGLTYDQTVYLYPVWRELTVDVTYRADGSGTVSKSSEKVGLVSHLSSASPLGSDAEEQTGGIFVNWTFGPTEALPSQYFDHRSIFTGRGR